MNTSHKGVIELAPNEIKWSWLFLSTYTLQIIIYFL